MPKNAQLFLCESCDFKCCKKSNYDVHILTSKHIKANNANNNANNNAMIQELFLFHYMKQKVAKKLLINFITKSVTIILVKKVFSINIY